MPWSANGALFGLSPSACATVRPSRLPQFDQPADAGGNDAHALDERQRMTLGAFHDGRGGSAHAQPDLRNGDAQQPQQILDREVSVLNIRTPGPLATISMASR